VARPFGITIRRGREHVPAGRDEVKPRVVQRLARLAQRANVGQPLQRQRRTDLHSATSHSILINEI
jgi:hypothetical protein